MKATREFFKAAGIRAARTAAQAALAVIGTGSVGLVDVDWANLSSITGGAVLVSFLMSVITGLPEDTDNPGKHAADA